MEVTLFPTDLLGVNCYLMIDSGEAILVDPAGAGEEVLECVAENQLDVIAIINTHGHADHIAQNAWFQQQLDAPIWIHELDEEFLMRPDWNLSGLIGQELRGPAANRLLRQEEITLGDTRVAVLHTPGHSPGSICLYSPGVLVSGDTLFSKSVGRTDFPGGDSRKLQQSIKRLATLPPDTVIYPGHGPETTLADELRENPYLCRLQPK